MSNKNPKPQATSAQSGVAEQEALQQDEQARLAAEEAAQKQAEEEQAAAAKAAEEAEAARAQEAARLQQAQQAAAEAPLAGEVGEASNVQAMLQEAAVGKVVEQAAPVSTDELQAKLDKILAKVPAAFSADITRVRLYCQAMAPGLMINDRAGAVEQAALYRSIQNIINRQAEHFQPLFTALLAIFNAERKGALGDRYRNRFMDSVALNKADREAFQNLTHLLSVTYDPASREITLKQVRLEKALASGLTAEGQRRVLAYFGA
jgi:hypothetical protein